MHPTPSNGNWNHTRHGRFEKGYNFDPYHNLQLTLVRSATEGVQSRVVEVDGGGP